MAEISQKDQLALHEFSLRMREAMAARSAEKDQDLGPVIEAVRDQYTMEQQTKNEPVIEPPAPARDQEPEKPEPEP